MGPGSVAAPKTEVGRALPMIGWDIDLDMRTVSLSRKNLNKTLFAFFSVRLDCGITLPVLQALASRASRAALLAPAMKPFIQGLFGSMSLYNGSRTACRMLSAAAKLDVMMWRAFLVQLMWAPQVFARTLESFRPRPALFLLEYDASLTGLRVQVSRRADISTAWIPWFHCGECLPFGEQTESGRQNLCEFVAVLAGVLVMRQLGCMEFVVDIKGDNTSSLSWLRKGRVNSTLARRASVGFSLLMANLGASVGITEHVAGSSNMSMDGLSRGMSARSLGLDPRQTVRVGTHGWVWRFPGRLPTWGRGVRGRVHCGHSRFLGFVAHTRSAR
jgi:hypothetical protein